jgi:hypothetical protein
MTRRNRSWSTLVAGSLLLCVVLSAGVLAAVETNYSTAVRSDESTARVTAVDHDEEGLVFRLEVENHLNRPVRVDYVRLDITEGDRSVVVSVPFGGRVAVPPTGGTVDAFVSARRHARLSPIEGTITVQGYVAVTAYQNHRFTITVVESEVEP